ncbi:MAG: hypothetical protein KDA51_11400 [Planctomycetales bacterium]|nr:hypothetical protein [Planctomycetales bacterium]
MSVSTETDIRDDPINYFAVDPGNTESGWVFCRRNTDVLGGLDIIDSGIDKNEDLRRSMASSGSIPTTRLLIETPKPQGMLMSSEMVDTIVHIGRFIQLWSTYGGRYSLVFRPHVKLHLCGRATAKDPNVTQALKDRFGGVSVAVGGKKCTKCKGRGWLGRDHDNCDSCDGSGWGVPKGPLYGITSHRWAALALACYFVDTGQLFTRVTNPETSGRKPGAKKKK